MVDKLAQDRRPTIDLKLAAADDGDELNKKPNFTTNEKEQEVLLCPSPTNESTTTADLTFENEEEEVPLWEEEDEVDLTPSLETTSVDDEDSSSYEEEQVNNHLPPPAPISPLPSSSPLATVRKSFFSSWRRPSLNLEQQHQYTLGDHLEYLHISSSSTSSSSNLYFTDIGHLSPMQSSLPNIVKEYISQPSQEQLNAMYFVSEQSSPKEEQHAEKAPLPIRTLSIRLSPEAASSSSTSLLETIEASCGRYGKVLKKTPTMLQMHLALPEEQSSVVLDVRLAASKTTCSPERHVLLRLYFADDIPRSTSRSGSPLHAIVESDEEEYASDHDEEEEEEDLHESFTSVDRLGESCSSILSSSSTSSSIPPQTIISTLKESSSLLQLLQQQPGQTLESLCPSSSVQGTSKWLLQNFDLQASSKEQDCDTTATMAFPILCIADSMILHASDSAIYSILESISSSMYTGSPSDNMLSLDPVFDLQLQSMSHANMMGRLHDAKDLIQCSMRPVIDNLLELQQVVHAAYSKFYVKLPSSSSTKMPTLVLPSLPSVVSDHHRTTEAITSSSVQEIYQQIISRHDGHLEAYIQALNMAYLHHIDALRAILSKDIQTLECLAPSGIADITAQALLSGKQDGNNNDSAYHVPLLQLLLTTTSTTTTSSPREKRRLPHRCWITGTHVLLLGRNDTTQIYELGDPRVTWKDQQESGSLELTVVANDNDQAQPLTVQLQPQDDPRGGGRRTCGGASRSLGTVLDTLLSLGLMDAEDTIFDM